MFDSINFVTSSIFTWDLFVSWQHSENRNQQNTEFGPIFLRRKIIRESLNMLSIFKYQSVTLRQSYNFTDRCEKQKWTDTNSLSGLDASLDVLPICWCNIFSLSLSSYSNWSANCIVKWEAKRVFEYHTHSSITFLAGNVLTIDNDVDKYLLSFSPQVD